MASDEFDTSSLSTPSLAAYLGWHILKKGFQAGGILAVPLAPLVQYVRQRKLVVGAVLTTAGVTVAGATALTAALGAARFTQLDRDGFADRCYRLYFNEGQRRCLGLASPAKGPGRRSNGSGCGVGLLQCVRSLAEALVASVAPCGIEALN
ncbi:uncharacterized protein HaLaN_25826, partial [Haematococcus lacustris]